MRVIRANGTISPFPSRGVDMGIRDAGEDDPVPSSMCCKLFG